MFFIVLCDPVTLSCINVFVGMSNPPSWPEACLWCLLWSPAWCFFPECMMYPILRGYVAITSFPVESNSHKVRPYTWQVQNNIWAKSVPGACSPTWHAVMVKGRELARSASGWLCAQLTSVHPQLRFQTSKYKVCTGVLGHTHNHCTVSPGLLGKHNLSWITTNWLFQTVHFLRKFLNHLYLKKKKVGENN